MSLSSRFQGMSSLNHWKFFIQLKEYLSKSSKDGGVLFIVTKEWNNVVQKLPSLYKQIEYDSNKIEQSTPKSITSDIQDKVSSNGSSGTTTALTKPDNSAEKKNLDIKSPEERTSLSPKWKVKKEFVSKASIDSRTKHVLTSVAAAGNLDSQLSRVDALIEHFMQYPESKNLAIKNGAGSILLRIKHGTNDKQLLGAIREACSVLGYVESLPGRGIRILSIDGGGIRGVIVIELLKKLEQLTGKKIHELFDFVCGVSTGAILLSVLVPQKKPLDELSFLYKDLSTKIFTQSAFWGTSSLVWSHSYYDTNMWENLLKQYIGDLNLLKTVRDPECPRLAAVSAVVNQTRVSAYVFRNYSHPPGLQSQYIGTNKYKLWEAVRASAAAPSYFEEFKLGGLLHQDGGILVNNPCAVAIHEAKLLWPGCPIQCVVSFGTGRFDPLPDMATEDVKVNVSSWKTKFLKILDSATDTEAVHTMLSDLLPSNVYYRFNPYLTEMVSMVEINPDKIKQLEQDALMYYRRNEEAFKEAADALLLSATVSQRCQNWFNERLKLWGFT